MLVREEMKKDKVPHICNMTVLVSSIAFSSADCVIMVISAHELEGLSNLMRVWRCVLTRSEINTRSHVLVGGRGILM